MPARAITRELYAEAVAWFRAHPADSTGCARAIGVHYKTALRLWKGPQNKIWPWARPIQEVLHEEMRREMAEREKAEEERRLAIAKEAERARKIEHDTIQFEEHALGVARADVLHGLAAINQLTRGVGKLAKEVNAQLEAGVDSEGRPLRIDVGKCLGVIRSYTTSVKGLTQAAETLVQLGRLQRQLPTTIVGLDVASVTIEQAEREVAFANRALERAKLLGLRTGEEIQDAEIVDE
jgi:hypothetical protein